MQRQAVASLCAARGLSLIGQFTEIETGKRNARPEFEDAIAQARASGASLVVAKLDQLSRSPAFTLQLRNSGLDFICADNPEVNPMTIGHLAVANQERSERISQRTREALAEARERARVGGVNKRGLPYKVARLGNPNGAAPLHRAARGKVAALAARMAAIDARAAGLAAVVAKLREEGANSLRKLAAGLEALHIPGPRGGRWHPSSVKQLLAQIKTIQGPGDLSH